MPYTFQSETSDIHVVEVKKSKINKAGKGLFAKQAIKINFCLSIFQRLEFRRMKNYPRLISILWRSGGVSIY
jgi:hypothetical protein